jgi:hypothetical protein
VHLQTHYVARSIQHYVSEREKRGPEKHCSPTTYTIVLADNIDFMHAEIKLAVGMVLQYRQFNSLMPSRNYACEKLRLVTFDVKLVPEVGAGSCISGTNRMVMSHVQNNVV